MSQRKKAILRALFIALMLAMANAIFQQARADCRFTNPNADPTILFTLPAQLVIESDTPVGTIIYSGDTVGESHGLTCDSSVWLREGYTALTDADYSGVLAGVYKTTVPGIGFRAARSENKTATFTEENMITPMHTIGMAGNWVSYDSTYARAEFTYRGGPHGNPARRWSSLSQREISGEIQPAYTVTWDSWPSEL